MLSEATRLTGMPSTCTTPGSTKKSDTGGRCYIDFFINFNNVQPAFIIILKDNDGKTLNLNRYNQAISCSV